MIVLVLLICGLTIGVMSSFFGIGGGAIMVPVLYSLFTQLDNTVVISTSLTTIFVLTALNSFKFYKDDVFHNRKNIITITFACLLGGYAGGLFTELINTAFSKKILALILVLSILRLFLYSPPEVKEEKIIVWKIFVTGLLGSLLSSLTGLGGGIVFVPMLLSFVHLPSRHVSAYSNLMMVSATFMGALPHILSSPPSQHGLPLVLEDYFLGKVNLAIALVFILGGFFGTQIGHKLHVRISEKTKKISFACVLFFLIIKLVVS